MEKKRETTIWGLYRGNIGILENKMESTIWHPTSKLADATK